MVDTPRRRYRQAVQEGSRLLDRGYEQFRDGDTQDAEESARDALSQFRLADVLSGFTFASSEDGSEIADEIDRSERLLQRVSADTPALRSPASKVLVYDERLAAGDTALRTDDQNAARDAYMAAYAALYSLLIDPEAFNLPSPPEATEPDSSVAQEVGDDTCGLCWVASPERLLQFRDTSIRTCPRCADLIGERFSTSERLQTLCERTLTDLKEVIDAPHGVPWTSWGTSYNDEPTPDSVDLGDNTITPEQVHLLRDLVAVSQRVGRPATPADFRRHGTHDPSAIHAAFGSWERALDETGLGVEKDRKTD